MYLYPPSHFELPIRLSKMSVRVYGRETRIGWDFGRGFGRGRPTYLTRTGSSIHEWIKYKGVVDGPGCASPPKSCSSISLSRSSILRFLFRCLVCSRCACDSDRCLSSVAFNSESISSPYLLA